MGTSSHKKERGLLGKKRKSAVNVRTWLFQREKENYGQKNACQGLEAATKEDEKVIGKKGRDGK